MIAALLMLAVPADAHITLTFPDGRFGNPNTQKDGPCGLGGPMDQRGPNVQTFLPGETIDITWTETINHNSHFRISFDEDGQDFEDPPEVDAYYSNALVEIDEIQDDPSFTYSESFTFPLVECTTCTLQLIQVMYEGNYDPVDDLYYQCADIELAYADPGDTDDTDSDTDVPVDTDTDVPPVDTDNPGTPPVDTDEPDVGGGGTGDDSGGCFGGCAGVGAPISMMAASLALLAGLGRRRCPRR